MKRRIADFIRCRRAVIATEFALVAPVMILIWLGIVELGSAQLAARKVELAAQAAADLIAQEETMDDTKRDNIVAAINTILAPFPITAANFGWSMTSIESDAADATSVGWYRSGGTISGTGSVPAAAEPLVSGNDSVIAVTVTYTHTPWLERNFVTGGNIALSETMFAKPRLVSVICYDGVTSTACP